MLSSVDPATEEWMSVDGFANPGFLYAPRCHL